MQPIAIDINGQFWDSQIYRGKLYLFDRSSVILTFNWDSFVSTISPSSYLRLAMGCAFQRSDYLYGSYLKPFLHDTEFLELFRHKFTRLAEHRFSFEPESRQNELVDKQDNPFPFPHTDTIIYARKIYSSGDQGIYRATCDTGRTKFPISSRSQRQWDCPTISLAAGYGTLALAAGQEGLWNIQVGQSTYFYEGQAVNRLSKHDCDQCQFMYFSIYGSSFQKGGFLAKFENDIAENDFRERKFLRVITGEHIFDVQGYSWGARDKIYIMHGRSISIVNYNPFAKQDQLKVIDTIRIQEWKGDFVSAGVATFGAIIELDNAIVVLTSDGQSYTLPGEPVRWRVFPNSHHYQNQLHVIYEDKMTIFSFNGDYFVQQESKSLGVRALISENYAERRVNEKLISQIL